MLANINNVMRDFVDCEKCALTVRLNVAKGYAEKETEEEFLAALDRFAKAYV